ncbi:MAG TPA: aminoacyl-tRNA hydrolase [Candidatus Saccharimonadales bacterium]|nr:aminoacyl-tRNA hydrolase [Candidatus Saccharimonadales bacterium]
MKLIIGLGNIGTHFEKTRHNVGFMAVDAWVQAHQSEWQSKDKFKALVAETTLHNEKIILIKPTTYYNLSGDATRLVKDFYKIDTQNILVVHDELALPFGTVRMRQGGSDAGNNGIKSIVATIGADFARIRVGIANDLLATHDAADFVLNRFTPSETEQWPTINHEVMRHITAFADESQTFFPTSVRV